jgi:hypothetical protein
LCSSQIYGNFKAREGKTSLERCQIVEISGKKDPRKGKLGRKRLKHLVES